MNKNIYSNSYKKNRGFTMLELLIVIAIIGILATTLAPKLLKEIRKATVAKVQHNLGVIRSRLSLDDTFLDEFPDLAGGDNLNSPGEDNVDLLRAYSIEPTPPFTDENGKSYKETSEVLPTRTNEGGWYYIRSSGEIYANLPNGAYTYDKVYEIWNTQEVQSLIDSGIVNENGEYLNNPSFEKNIPSFSGEWTLFNQNLIDSWKSDTPGYQVEVWKDGMNGIEAKNGEYFIELNSNKSGSLYQDLETVPGTTLVWTVSHRGRSESGDDVASLSVGTGSGLEVQETMTDGNDGWVTYTQEYIVPEGQTTTRFSLNSISSVGGSSYGNLIDNFTVKVK